jgi:hypothetical protein
MIATIRLQSAFRENHRQHGLDGRRMPSQFAVSAYASDFRQWRNRRKLADRALISSFMSPDDLGVSRVLLLKTAFAILVSAWSVAALAGVTKQQTAELAEALRNNNSEAIYRAVSSIVESLGEQRGVPEIGDRYTRIVNGATMLTKSEAISSIAMAASQIEQGRWWHIGLDPTQLSRPLREPASAITGLLAFSRVMQVTSVLGAATPKGTANRDAQIDDRYVEAARKAGDFLLWAQTEAGTGVFPFPAFVGKADSAAFRSAERQRVRIAERGLANAVRNGWAIEDGDDGGLQFDNGECGVAMFALFEATRDKRYLDSAILSAEWASRRPLVVNWNYNAFSVRLLARAYLITGRQSFLDGAIQKAALGVIPGQLESGPHKGRWADRHNARPVYHYIMMDSLVDLIAAMRKAGLQRTSDTNRFVAALRSGLTARNGDYLPGGRGATTKETAMIALLNAQRTFADDAAFMRETLSREALEGLMKMVSGQFRRGHMPLAPGAWGLFVEHAAAR